MPIFVSNADLKTSLAAMLKVAAADLPALWDSIISESNESAYQDIVGALSDRGYSAAQIAAWDRAEEYERDIGLFWCMTKGAGLHGNDPTFIFKLDRRSELAEVPIMVGGELVTPDGSEDVVGYGLLDTDTDLYTRDTRDASGTITRGTTW